MDELQILIENNNFKSKIPDLINDVILIIKNIELEELYSKNKIGEDSMNNEKTKFIKLKTSNPQNNLKLSEEIRELKKIYTDLIESKYNKNSKNFSLEINELKSKYEELLKENNLYENAISDQKNTNNLPDFIKNSQEELYSLDSNISNIKRINHNLRSKINISKRYYMNILNKLSLIEDEINKLGNITKNEENPKKRNSVDFRKNIELLKKKDLRIIENEKQLNALENEEKELIKEIDSLIVENKYIDRFLQITDKSINLMNANNRSKSKMNIDSSKSNDKSQSKLNSKIINNNQKYSKNEINHTNVTTDYQNKTKTKMKVIIQI